MVELREHDHGHLLAVPSHQLGVFTRSGALFGWWNEQETSDRAFLTATRHMAKASLLAMREILEIQVQAIFIQSESSEYTHTVCGCQHIHERVEWENQARFLALDLLYGHEVQADIHAWLLDNGMGRDEYRWFMNQGLHARCVMGNDYYVTNERIVKHDGTLAHVGEVFGWYLVTREYYQRYHKPVMHTETNLREEDNAVAWLWKQWQNLLRMRAEGIPVLGFTWYSLTDQVDWDTALREPNGNVNPLGLYDLNRNIHPVGTAYKTLIEEFAWLPIIPHGTFLSVM
jgi:beta-glucosidase